MRVGIDIDNTIICYDKAFALLAKMTGFDVPPSASKQEVKAWFHQNGLYEEFTILQGQVYESSSQWRTYSKVCRILLPTR